MTQNDLQTPASSTRRARAGVIPPTMRAVLLTGHGGLETLSYRQDVAVPAPGTGDVLVRVHACAVNNTDINMRVGWYGASVTTGFSEDIAIRGLTRESQEPASWDRQTIEFPRIQGAAISGEIAAVGAGVDPAKVGIRVVVDPVIRDMRLKKWARAVQYVGSERHGGFADYVVVPVENALPAPDGPSHVQLSCLPCAYQTAEEMQIRSHVDKGDRVLVTGASGGVGLANVLLAKLRGAHVTAIVSGSKAAAVREHGADVVVPRDSESFAADLAGAVGERGIDVVLDVVGGDLTQHLWHVLARSGRYSTAGAIGGPKTVVDLRELIYKDLEMSGVTFPEAQALENLLSYVTSGRLSPVVDDVFPLSEMAQAQAKFATRQHVGKIVIDLDQT
jgi:NADPH:quinone reductase-like Zn-dependent oxidoreductase